MFLQYFKLWRDYDLFCMIYSTIGLMIQFINYEYDMSGNPSHHRSPELYPSPMDDPIFKNPKTNIIRMTVVGTSLSAVYCLIQRHRYKTKWKRVYYDFDNHTYTYLNFTDVLSSLKDSKFIPEHSSAFSFHVFIELITLMICPIPFYDKYMPHSPRVNMVVNYYLSEYMLSIMAFRGFYIFRSYFNYSIFTDPYAKKLC